ncbi:MAG: MurR/RpiR family transcriptional regulator [Christensenellales bacterium]|jgi:DNA-binding MurR/RpiR family transcriptional regulator
MMEQQQDLISRMNAAYKGMSKGQKLIAEYIINNYDKAAFMTASRLGEKVGVSESTVVRFANELNYDGYPRLQKALQELIRNKLTSVQRIEMSQEMDQSAVLRTVLKADTANLRHTMEEMDETIFQQVVEALLSARKIYVLGLRSSAPLSQFLSYYLDFVMDNVVMVTSGLSDMFEQLIRIGPEDVLIGISFPRYSNRTIEAMHFARGKGAQTVAITDSRLSPLVGLSDNALIARSDMASFVDSLVAPMSLINALIVAISLRRSDQVSEHFKSLEKIWSQYNVYGTRETK